MFHPATLLTAWGGLALAFQQASFTGLAAASLLFLPPLAMGRAPRRAIRLLGRARWLFLSLALLFIFATPGEPVPNVPGATVEGFQLAGEHCLRLMLLLASLAALHEALGTIGMMAGLHTLLVPLATWRNLRERIVARLMLVLDHVEGDGGMSIGKGWRVWLAEEESAAVPDRLTLPVPASGWADWMALALLMSGALAWWLLS
ncbi:MAG: hypothetical protein Q8O34_02640 [Rhodocyclaceae bacterium]|nr:hypothetical protein [Rhodocyclaceae bacterium]